MEAKCCLKPTEKFLCSCSYEELLHTIAKKWTVVILNLLHSYGPLGYNALFNKISGISPKAFGDKLKLLEERGLITRQITENPLRVHYRLTAAGRKRLESLHLFFNTPIESHES